MIVHHEDHQQYYQHQHHHEDQHQHHHEDHHQHQHHYNFRDLTLHITTMIDIMIVSPGVAPGH